MIRTTSVDGIGLISPYFTPLPEDMWFGTPRKDIEKHLKELPSSTKSPALQGLMKRLLLSPFRLPPGAGKEGSLLRTRLRHLFYLRAYEPLKEVIERLPKSYMSEELKASYAIVLFHTGSDDIACKMTNDMLKTSQLTFWQKAQALCFSLLGEAEHAEMQIELYEEAGGSQRMPCCPLEYRQALGRIITPSMEDPVEVAGFDAASPLEQYILLKAGYVGKQELRARNSALLTPLLSQNEIGRTWDDEKIMEWYTSDQGLQPLKKTALAERLFTVLEAQDIRVPAQAWESLPALSFTPPKASSQPSHYLDELEKAKNARKIGETVIFSILAIGKDGPGYAHDYTVAKVIRALRGIGLEEEAKQLAFEAMLEYPL
jgi:hypothetical protein